MFSLILPAFNEEVSLKEKNFLRDFINIIKKKYSTAEIIVVNDGSDDETSQLLKIYDIELISHHTNKGYGSGIKTGINAAKYDTIITADIDGTYLPADVIKLYDFFYERNKFKNYSSLDMLVGKRKLKINNDGVLKAILRWFLKCIVNFSTGNKIEDINSGLRVFSKKTISKYLSRLSNAFSFSTTSTLCYLMDNKSLMYLEIDYLERPGKNNKSKVRIFSDSLRTLQSVIETLLYYNPLKFFLFLSLIFFIFTFIFFLLFTFSEIIIIKELSFLFFSISLLSFVLGFIATSINKSLRND